MEFRKEKTVASRLAATLLGALLLAIPLWAAPAAGAPSYRQGTVQDLTSGKVSGSEVNDGATLLWLGIPYAEPPVGALRWKAPQPLAASSGSFDATKGGALCPQLQAGKLVGSEDCLTLDIYRPNSPETGLPVLVYIHGGNNQGGTSQELDARHLAVTVNAVVVSVNYRLGLLGFNGLPALRTGSAEENSGNFSLLDISQSLKWIKANIDAFGGDGGNITVSGFSAGGRDVMAMLISPIFKGQFQKAISISGGMTIADRQASAKLTARALAPLVVADKVKADEDEAYQWLLTSSPDVGGYLRGLAADRLAGLMTNAGIRMTVFPHLFSDGAVLPKDGFATANYNSVPLIMLTSSKEFSLFARSDPEFAVLKDDELMDDAAKLRAYAFANDYGSKLYELFNAQESAEAMFASYKAPLYTLRIGWGGNPAIVGERMAKVYGSFHGVWIPFVTSATSGFSASFPAAFDNSGARDLSDKLGRYLGNFLRTGDPNGEGLVAWKPWVSATSGPTQLVVDADAEKAIIEMTEERTRYDDVLAEMEADGSIPEADKRHLIERVLNGRWFSRRLDLHFGNGSLWIMIE
ncbi:carboxylesterase family protein [Pleomorphomonas sp. NRK KF1]|uniref:carboxylesterase family protein n=1 Tax=Pleomorphomonas sp. NRK KF1 TaxID=2943000 RepID=UPI002043E815|nr:carboxylesterase family protein [Pleomorphomonas sp. NRK KF1]MCM5554288.1 carboxylesterase family protein [Pleomorphomonas sp. NRK KF1]